MKQIFVFVAIAIATAMTSFISCEKDAHQFQTSDKPSPTTPLSITVGFEGQTADDNTPESKLYLQSESRVQWSSNANDKVIYVFDNSNVKHVFTSSESGAARNRTFSADANDPITMDDIQYVLWSGKVATGSNSDVSTLSGNVFGGLNLKFDQKVNNVNSFAPDVNVAVMKVGDNALRNVFGYIRFSVPKAADNDYAAIKSVTFEADEFMTGDVQIDYSGTAPVATIASNGDKKVKVTTRFKNGYEPGNYYAVVPAGTYHNVKVTIEPFAEEASSQSASTGAVFTLNAKSAITVTRGQYTVIKGNLPYTDPSTVTYTWPNDPDAFDYGVTDSKTAEYPSKDSDNKYPTCPYTLDKVSYYGGSFGGDGKFNLNRCFAPTIANAISQSRYISFKINKPGTVDFIPRNISNANNTTPILYLAIRTTKNGASTDTIIFEKDMKDVSTSKLESERLYIPITSSNLEGITEAATVYIFLNTYQMTLYPLTWTVAP